MTIEDLREHGVLLPEEEWGEHALETTASELPLLLSFVVAAAAVVVAYVGDGGALTWVGTGVFLASLYAITWMCDRAVLRQRRRVESERGGRRRTAGAPADAEAESGPDGSEARGGGDTEDRV